MVRTSWQHSRLNAGHVRSQEFFNGTRKQLLEQHASWVNSKHGERFEYSAPVLPVDIQRVGARCQSGLGALIRWTRLKGREFVNS